METLATPNTSIEAEFSDHAMAIALDAEIRLESALLLRLYDWWKSTPSKAARVPPWQENYLSYLGYVGDHLHLHAMQASQDLVEVRFIGRAIIDVIGQDVTGQRYSSNSAGSPALQALALRCYEMIMLVRRMKVPLRVVPKFVRPMRGGKFSFETLWLPFSKCEDGEVDVLLGGTIYKRLPD